MKLINALVSFIISSSFIFFSKCYFLSSKYPQLYEEQLYVNQFKYRVQYSRYVNGKHDSDQVVVKFLEDLFVETFFESHVEVLVKVEDQAYRVEDDKYIKIKKFKPSANSYLEVAFKYYLNGILFFMGTEIINGIKCNIWLMESGIEVVEMFIPENSSDGVQLIKSYDSARQADFEIRFKSIDYESEIDENLFCVPSDSIVDSYETKGKQ